MTTRVIKTKPDLFERVTSILEEARNQVVRTVNTRMVVAYWLIGQEIVNAEQSGKQRAGYGETLLKDLSIRLTERFGKGHSLANLKNFRQFYLCFSNRLPQIRYAVRSEFTSSQMPFKTTLAKIRQTLSSQLPSKKPANIHNKEIHYTANAGLQPVGEQGFEPELSWSHYCLLMRVENKEARAFYEIEAAIARWSVRDLERQINSLLFERLLKSRNKNGVMTRARKGNTPSEPVDVLKDPYVLEFLDLPEGHELVENKLEQALVTRMRQFLLELGCGFAFVGRQQRLTLEGDHFYVDLVFYHTRLKCYVLIDLKIGKLSQADLGQMQLYVNYYDREICAPDDNPTVGLILCPDRNEAMVRYTLPAGQKQIFASRYRTALPSEEELARLLRRDWEIVVREQQPFYGIYYS